MKVELVNGHRIPEEGECFQYENSDVVYLRIGRANGVLSINGISIDHFPCIDIETGKIHQTACNDKEFIVLGTY
jgi:hypothetical protein